MYPMPEGQCLGKQSFQFALYPHAGDYVAGQVQAIADTAVLGTYTTFGGSLPPELLQGSILEVQPSAVRITALKPAEVGDHLVVRLLNDSDTAVDATIKIRLPVKAIEEVDLLEQTAAGNRVKMQKDNTAMLAMGPYEFATLLLKR
jgi:alpha-mannosidase